MQGILESLEPRRFLSASPTMLRDGYSPNTNGIVVPALRHQTFTISAASIRVSSKVTQGQPNPGQGVISGTGNGTVQYSWWITEPNGTSVQFSKVLDAAMETGVASIPLYGKLPTAGIGTYRVWVQTMSPTDSISSNVVIYKVNRPPPPISISAVPTIGHSGDAKGKVIGVHLSDYQGVAVYIEVAGGWWTKPYFDAPLTKISSNGTWKANIDTGGDDQDATNIIAFLIPDNFDVPLLGGSSSLPSSLLALPYAEVARS